MTHKWLHYRLEFESPTDAPEETVYDDLRR
jgi:hypothetical protein